MSSRWSGALSTEAPNPQLDLADYVGQRTATYEFSLVDEVTGYRRTITPLGENAPLLTHDTRRTIKRQISGMLLSVADTLIFDTITSRLEVNMLIAGETYPLGRYIPSAQLRQRTTAGLPSSPSFYDYGFIVDQELTRSFGTVESYPESTQFTLERLLSSYPIQYAIEPSPFTSTAAFPMGSQGGYAVEQLALDGDWFSPWFDHQNVYQFIRSFDPAGAVPTFNFDAGNKVFRQRIIEQDDLIDAPNRFVVISNGGSSVGTAASPAVGVYNIPSSAPHSEANRGFVIQKTVNRQLNSGAQAQAVAENLGKRSTVFEMVELSTAPDPRHDSYDVVRWQDANWLEVSWSLPLAEGAAMSHVLRKAYGS